MPIAIRLTLLILALALVAPACKGNEEKITEFCAAWKSAVDSNKDNCDKMGEALASVFDKHKNTKLYGSIDGEELAKVKAGCDEATKAMSACLGNPKMKEALKALKRRDAEKVDKPAEGAAPAEGAGEDKPAE